MKSEDSQPADYRYRGYWIRHNSLNGLWWVEKDGAFICYATDRTDGMRKIDEVLA